ncbi:MAG: aminotransferase class I/II-fold pyridoxal phosphate-dependent enzyme [Acetivibrionales bacterium]|jgi:lysine decarboxylase
MAISTLDAPLYNWLIKYAQSNPVPFHMPGHKMGKGMPESLFKDIARIDITEIPGADNLHYPEGIIDEAQKLAAGAFGADSTFFLVNGSTCGIHAMIMTICKPGEKLIVARDCHKSVIGAMILGRITPVYIKPGYIEEFGAPGTINATELEKILKQNPDARGVLITRPNYYGVCSDIQQIAQIVHSHGKALAVDEAHGAHLGFNVDLPVSALEAGADICVQSAHKTIPAFTQGSYLHIKKGRIDIDRLKFYLGMLQTSSPSYIIMSSLDLAREIMQKSGKLYLGNILEYRQWFEDMTGLVGGLEILKEEHVKKGTLDRTRIVVNCRGIGKTGFEVERALRAKYGIQVEMADINNIICIATVADRKEDFQKLYKALEELATINTNNNNLSNDIIVKDLEIPGTAIELKDMHRFGSCRRKISEAVGLISKGMITPYPPGIPLICPGEVITHQAVDYINGLIALGAVVNGVGKEQEVEVIC